MPEPLAELFSSRVRAAVLALVLPRPHLRFSLTDLSRRLGLPVSSLQHECYKLTRLGLLRDERVGNARLYRPDPAWPLLEPLTALTVRAMPLEEALRGAVEGVPGIEGAWVSGDLASPIGSGVRGRRGQSRGGGAGRGFRPLPGRPGSDRGRQSDRARVFPAG